MIHIDLNVRVSDAATPEEAARLLLGEALRKIARNARGRTARTVQPAATTAYTMEELSVAATPLVDEGRGREVQDLLSGKYGVDAIDMLPKAAYNAFAEDLRAMGAKL